MPIENPIVKNRNLPQHIWWDKLLNGTTYEFKIVLPYKSIAWEYAKAGAYVTLVMQVLSDNQLKFHSLIKDEYVIIDFPYRIFEVMWQGLSYKFRKEFQENHNLIFKFLKVNQKTIEPLDAQKCECTTEESKLALQVYNNPRLYSHAEIPFNPEPIKIEKGDTI